MNQLQPHVHRASVIAMRLVDIADTIDLAAVESLWARHAHTAAARSRLITTPAKAMSFGVPPVVLALEPVQVIIDGQPVQASVMARLYEFGVAAFSVRVASDDLPWAAFTARVNAVDAALGIASGNELWPRLVAQIAVELARAVCSSVDAPVGEHRVGTVVDLIAGPDAGR